MYQDFCDECNVPMTRLSRDRTQIICDHCFVPKPVPHNALPISTRRAEVQRLKTFQSTRNTGATKRR